IPHHRSCHRDRLSLPACQGRHHVADDPDLDLEALEYLDGTPFHADFVEHLGFGQLATQVQVGDDIEVVAKGKILIDRRDAELSGIARTGNRYRMTFEEDLTAIW